MTRVMERQIKSRERVQALGEVFTPSGTVSDMLDLVPFGPFDKVLEPTCGTGNFLIQVVDRKLEQVRDVDSALRIAGSVYGVDIDAENVNDAREVVISTVLDWAPGMADAHADELRDIVTANIVQGDAVSWTDVTGNPLVFVDHEDNRSGLPVSDLAFELVVGNPPYQEHVPGSSAKPIFGEFVQAAAALDTHYVCMVTPSRWLTGGGRELPEFREWMLSQRALVKLVHFPEHTDVFTEAKVRGGVSYFLFENGYVGPVEYSESRDGVIVTSSQRELNEYDVFVRFDEGLSVLAKIRDRETGLDVTTGAGSLEQRFSSQIPFGLRSNYAGAKDEPGPEDVPVYRFEARKRVIGWAPRDEATRKPEWIDAHKVLLPKAGYGAAILPTPVTGKTWLAPGPSMCTQTFLVAGRFDDLDEARRYEQYLRTRFVRFLVHLRLSTHDIRPATMRFIPDLPMDRDWHDECEQKCDACLFHRYGLRDYEIDFIKSQIA